MKPEVVEKLLELLVKTDSDPIVEDPQLRIVVLDRGFVVIGRVHRSGDHLIIEDCQQIRRWGTSRGLGQLATEGKQPDTKLDPQPTTRVHVLQVVQQIDCEVLKWNL